ncbi:hypothetical protein PsalN5692_01873 [Piscirickettsia salmonis]|uniref:hypothetical protein n=1 Tax=Piscirickettsia salmonis TaxID=1238 RepID=UPI0012B78F8E|nr:hypothetical protein PsalN5692_01873 [Piscirickettsia salmonis]
MNSSTKSLKREIAFNIDKVYQQFYQYTARLKKNRLIDLYHSLFCTLPSSGLVKLNYLESSNNGAISSINKGQGLMVSGMDETYEAMNVFESPLYDLTKVNYSFNNEKIIISLEFNQDVTVNAESRFRFYLQHEEAIETVAAFSFLKTSVCGSQVIINQDLEFKAYLDCQNIDSLVCRNQLLRQMLHSPEHFCFFDLMINVATPYLTRQLDFYIELNSYDCVGEVVQHLEWNALTLLGVYPRHANRIYLNNDIDCYPLLFDDDHSDFFKLLRIHHQDSDIYPRYLFHDYSALNYTLHYESFSKPLLELHYTGVDDKTAAPGFIDIECLCFTDLLIQEIEQVADVEEKAIFLPVATQPAKLMNYDDRQVIVERFMAINFGNVTDLNSIQVFFDLLVEKDSLFFGLRKRMIRTEVTRISDTFVICLHVLIGDVLDEHLFAYLCKVLQRFINYNFTNMLNYRVVYKTLK